MWHFIDRLWLSLLWSVSINILIGWPNQISRNIGASFVFEDSAPENFSMLLDGIQEARLVFHLDSCSLGTYGLWLHNCPNQTHSKFQPVQCVNCSERPAFLIASACSICFNPHFSPWNIFLDCGPVYGCVCVSVSLCWAGEQAGVPLQNAVMHPEYVHIKILITSCWSRLWTSSALAVFSGGCSSTPKIPQHICY